LPVFGLALAALAGAHAFDYVTFLVMVQRHGLGAELNPIVTMLATEVGIPGLTIAKVAAVTFLGATSAVILPTRKRLASGLIAVGIVMGMFGGFSNVISI
jgi:hypothetical protein